MSGSERYGDLVKGVRELRHALLPPRFGATGAYRSPRQVHLRAVSFRILVHAEVESFLEDRALALFDAAWRAWEEAGVPSRVITALLAFSGVATSLPPRRLGGDSTNQKAYETLSEPIQKAQSIWRSAQKENHGVKEANVLSLLLPLGVDPAALDVTLLADLSSYGADRGHVAHASPVYLSQYLDPQVEWLRASQLVSDLERIDTLISDAIKEVSVLQKALTPRRANRTSTPAGSAPTQ